MCILLIAIDALPDWPLVLLGNRDEFHARPSTPAQPWAGTSDCLGGLDEVGGGSWLAQRNDGRFAAITNLRSGLPAQAPRSRGLLVREFVVGSQPATEFAERVIRHMDEYGPFNLILGCRDAVWVIDGHSQSVQRLPRGVHVVSNGPLGCDWPKVRRLRERFEQSIRNGHRDDASLLNLLMDESQPDPGTLPDTGVGPQLERVLAPIFIRGEHYGTRASSLVMQHEDGSVFFSERSFAASAANAADVSWRCLAIHGEWQLD